MPIVESPITLANFGRAQGWAGRDRIVVDADLSNYWGSDLFIPAGTPGHDDYPFLHAFNPQIASYGDRDYGGDIVGFGVNNVIIGYGGVWGPGDAASTGEGFRVFAGNVFVDGQSTGPQGSFITLALPYVPELQRGADYAGNDVTGPGDDAAPVGTPFANPSNDFGDSVWAQTATGFSFYSPTHTTNTIVDSAGHEHYIYDYNQTAQTYAEYGSAQGWTAAHNVQVAFAEMSYQPSPPAFPGHTGDFYASIFGFGQNGIVVTNEAFSLADGVAQTPYITGTGWGNAAGYTETRDIRTVTDYLSHEIDLNDDGILDVVGMGPSGLVYSYGFEGPGDEWQTGAPIVSQVDFGNNQGWTNATPRILVDADNDGDLDVIGFGTNGVIVSWGNPVVNPLTDNPFGPAQFALANFGTNQGWNAANHVRAMGDVNGDSYMDIVGFGQNATYVSLFDPGTHTWLQPEADGILGNLAAAQGWSTTQDVRTLADVDQDGSMDIIAMGANGTTVWNYI
jgi:hypothetical protein